MIELRNETKQVIFNNKKFLQKNDLGGFWKNLINFYKNSNEIGFQDVADISQFLRQQGIKFEDYLNYLPESSCAFDFYPTDWVKSDGTTLVLPAKLETIEVDALSHCHYVSTIECPGVHTIEIAAFEASDMNTIFIGQSIKKISTLAFSRCKQLQNIYVVDEVSGQKVLHYLDQELTHFNNDIDIIDAYTGEVYYTHKKG